MKDTYAVRVNNVNKDFRLPHEKAHTIKELFIHPFRQRSTETQHALKDINFNIQKGEFFGIVGRNGSGKSTMLKIIAGIYHPTTGEVDVDGSLVPFIELGVGFNNELSGRDNVYLNGALLGFSREEMNQMYDDIVSFAELENFMDQKLKNYSSGMQVRLAFSIAIKADSDILLIDEVLAVGDASFQRKCFDYFRQLKKKKKTVILVTHNMSAVREYCTRAVVIEESKIIFDGDPSVAANKYNDLFQEEVVEMTDKKDKTGKRYGTQEIIFDKVNVPKAVNRDSDEIIIKTTAKVKKSIDSPNFGFSIQDESGKYICGTNTQIKKLKVNKLRNGDEVTITWTVPNIFHDGLHYINIAVVDYGEASRIDWWEEAASFKVYKDERTPYPTTPPIDVDVEYN